MDKTTTEQDLRFILRQLNNLTVVVETMLKNEVKRWNHITKTERMALTI